MAVEADKTGGVMPCTNHPAGAFTRQHCDGADCVWQTGCHVAAYCRRCDWQWVEPCAEHERAAA